MGKCLCCPAGKRSFAGSADFELCALPLFLPDNLPDRNAYSAPILVMTSGWISFARLKFFARWHLLVLVLMSLLASFAAEPTLKTYTFKTVGPQENDLQADVHSPPGDAVQPRPVIVFIHGGALMMGDRKITPRPGSLLTAMLDAGYVVVSIDYRLAPQVKLPAILEDMRDACAWVSKQGPELFHIDPNNLFVMGQSAGGYLTLMSGLRGQPRPRALVSFWGYGDIAGPWYSRPDAHYCEQPLVTKEEADKSGGGKLYLYCRQQGLWPQVLTGHDPDKEPRVFDEFCPDRNVSRDYPPTLLIHGTKDTDVPYELSVRMAKELAAKGVPHEFITIPDGGHGFSRRDQETATNTYLKVVEFLRKYQKH